MSQSEEGGKFVATALQLRRRRTSGHELDQEAKRSNFLGIFLLFASETTAEMAVDGRKHDMALCIWCFCRAWRRLCVVGEGFVEWCRAQRGRSVQPSLILCKGRSGSNRYRSNLAKAATEQHGNDYRTQEKYNLHVSTFYLYKLCILRKILNSHEHSAEN